MQNNLEAMQEVVKFIYDNIQYAEFNTKSDYCHVCGWDGEIIINDDNEWECPNCHNKDHNKDERDAPYLRLSRREFLEPRQDEGDQVARFASVILRRRREENV